MIFGSFSILDLFSADTRFFPRISSAPKAEHFKGTMIFVIEFVLALAVFASAANINVIVGADDSSVFEPPSVRAQKGDVLQFEL